MITRDLFDRHGAKVATVILHKGKLTVRTEDRALEKRLSAYFHAPETLWENGARRLELAGSEAHLEARLRGIHRHGLS